jgi:hypothetical protein
VTSRPGRRLGHAPRRGALRLADALTLVAVGVVVVLVSLPRLRDFALRENEVDARTLVTRLGALASRDAAADDVHGLVAADRTLSRQLDDAEFLAGGRVLRRHGYLFEVLAAEEARATGVRVRAWPWRHRKTGFSSFAWTTGGTLVADPDREGRWSGLEAPPYEYGAYEYGARLR